MSLDLERLKARLKRHEGFRAFAYTDTTGHLTIGWGRNLAETGISTDEAEFMLSHDVTRALSRVAEAVPGYNRLDPVRQAVLVEMAFNMGMGKVLGFHDMLAALAAGNFLASAAAMRDSHWHKETGERAEELARMMETGTAS